MLYATPVPRALGDVSSDLQAGEHFNCFTSCYGIGATHAVFVELQTELNRALRLFNLSPVVVDGKIGTGTVRAIASLAQRTGAAAGALRAMTTILQVSRQAPTVIQVLRAIVTMHGNASTSKPATAAGNVAPVAPVSSAAPVPKVDPHNVQKLPPPDAPPPNVEKTIISREEVVRVGGERLWYAGASVAGLLTLSALVAWAALNRRKPA